MSNRYSEEAMKELSKAVSDNRIVKVKELVESGMVVISYTEYLKAVDGDHTEILRYFLEKDEAPLGQACYALCIAVHIKRNGSIATVIDFLKSRIDTCFSKAEVEEIIMKAIKQATSIGDVRYILASYGS